MMFDQNYLAVSVAAIAMFAIGALWYSPILFVKPWMRGLGKTSEDMKGKSPLIPLIGYLIQSFIAAMLIAIALTLTGISTLGGAIGLALAISVGFVGFSVFGNNFFEQRSWVVVIIDVGNTVVSYIVMAIILVLWR